MSEQVNKFSELMVVLLTNYGMSVLGAILTLIAGFVAAGWLSGLVNRAMRRAHRIDAVFHPAARDRSCVLPSWSSR